MLRTLLLMTLLVSISCAGKRAKKEDAELAKLHLEIGNGYFTSRRYPQALQEYLLAEQLDRKNPMVLNNLALVYYVRGELDSSIEKLQAALKIDHGFSDARNNLARIYIDKGKYPEAIKELEEVKKDLVYRQPEKSWANLALAYFHLKQFEAAKSALRQAISLNRQYCPAYTLYGRTLFEQKKFGEAAQQLDKAVAICRQQNFDEANYYSALSYLKTGDTERARARMQEVITHFPNGEYAEKAQSMLKLIR